jgi:hypothetical protein
MPAFPPRPIDSTLHGVVDYAAGTSLTTVFPKLAGLEGTRAARQIRSAGAIHLTYSAMTNYPLGLIKIIPYKAHLGIDAIGALALAATPFLTGQHRKGSRQWVPHVALSLFEIASLAMTDPTGKGEFHGDIEAVREANREDPHSKIYEGPPAVRRPVASEAEALASFSSLQSGEVDHTG